MGIDLLRLSEEEMRQARFADIALIPQGAMNSLNPMMKIGEQLRDTIRRPASGDSKVAVDSAHPRGAGIGGSATRRDGQPIRTS